MAFDSRRNVAVLTGGLTPGPVSGETWEWNGTAWSLSPSSDLPTRFGHAMAFDSARGVCVLFGGYDYDAGYRGDTWEWDGSHWTQRSSTGPSPRRFHAMTYDAARGVTVLFGGYTSSSAFSTETWEWDGTEWSQRGVSGPQLPQTPAMVFDEARAVSVLFGGETWEWDGASWIQRVSVGPSPRRLHAMAYDNDRHVSVLVGGYMGGTTYSDETWEWNGTEWAQLAATGPAARGMHAMTYDRARGACVLFGGGRAAFGASETWYGDTWTLALSSSAFAPAVLPTSQAICPDAVALFTVYPIGAGPFEYSWRVNSVEIGLASNPSAHSATLAVPGAIGINDGLYDCVVSSGSQSVVSLAGALTVVPANDAPCNSPCDRIDFNLDGLFPDTLDIDDFLSVFSGGPCSTAPFPGCGDIDFNNDGLFPDTLDIDSLLSAFSGGPCV